MTAPTTDKHDAQPETNLTAGSSGSSDQSHPEPGRDTCASEPKLPASTPTILNECAAAAASLPSSKPGESKRWWLGVLVGATVGLPVGWLLSYAGTLPLMIGPFFFALFGLVIGATIYRVASPDRPYRSSVLLIGTTMIVALVCSETIVLESRDFPIEMASQASSHTRTLGDRSIEDFTAQTTNGVRRYLKDSFPPGGTIGYVRWILTQGRIPTGEIEGVRMTLTPLQSGLTWAIRVVLSIVLLAFGIGSQTLGLRQYKTNAKT